MSAIRRSTSRPRATPACALRVVPYGYNGGQPIESANPDKVFPGLLDVAHHALNQGTVSSR